MCRTVHEDGFGAHVFLICSATSWSQRGRRLNSSEDTDMDVYSRPI